VRSYFSFSNFVLWKEFELPLLKFSKVLVVLNHNQSNTYMYTHTQRHISMYEFIYVYSPHLHTYTGKRCKILVSTLMSNLSSLHSSVTSLNWLQVTLPTWEAMELKNHITPFFFLWKNHVKCIWSWNHIRSYCLKPVKGNHQGQYTGRQSTYRIIWDP
jgi:hypothetical protein